MALIKITFSNSRNDAGDTSECLRSSGLRGGAKPLLPLDNCWLEPSLTSECRRWMASITGTSSSESVESCGKHTRDAIFLLHTLQRHDIYTGRIGNGRFLGRKFARVHHKECEKQHQNINISRPPNFTWLSVRDAFFSIKDSTTNTK